MRLHKLCWLFMASLLLVVAAACRGAHDAEEKYYLVSANIKVAYWQAAKAGFMEAASNLHVRAEFVGPDTYDPQQQLEAFRHAVRQQPTGILISVTDPALLGPEIDAAIAAGIPVITIDSDAPQSNRVLFIGTNNYQAGVTGGTVAAEVLRGRGNLVVFTMPEQPNLAERLSGYREAFSAHPGIRIVEVVDIKGDPRRAFDAASEILGKRRNQVDGFICLEALAGPEIAEVLHRAGATDKLVIAMDTDEGTLRWIDRGVIRATIAQKPYTMGYFGLRMLDQLHHDGESARSPESLGGPHSRIPAFVDTGATLIDKANVQRFLQ